MLDTCKITHSPTQKLKYYVKIQKLLKNNQIMVLYIHDWRLCLLGVKHDNLPSVIHEMSSLYQESCSVTHD